MSAEPIGPQADVDSVVRYLADLSERIRTMQEEADRYRAEGWVSHFGMQRRELVGRIPFLQRALDSTWGPM